jgi:YD repeat-containing protein
MEHGELVAFLAATQKYSIPEAFTEADSLISGEWDELHVSDAEGTSYVITYDAEAELFAVTDNLR